MYIILIVKLYVKPKIYNRQALNHELQSLFCIEFFIFIQIQRNQHRIFLSRASFFRILFAISEAKMYIQSNLNFYFTPSHLLYFYWYSQRTLYHKHKKLIMLKYSNFRQYVCTNNRQSMDMNSLTVLSDNRKNGSF